MDALLWIMGMVENNLNSAWLGGGAQTRQCFPDNMLLNWVLRYNGVQRDTEGVMWKDVPAGIDSLREAWNAGQGPQEPSAVVLIL